jgi:hypothetical protein
LIALRNSVPRSSRKGPPVIPTGGPFPLVRCGIGKSGGKCGNLAIAPFGRQMGRIAKLFVEDQLQLVGSHSIPGPILLGFTPDQVLGSCMGHEPGYDGNRRVKSCLCRALRILTMFIGGSYGGPMSGIGGWGW